MTERQTTYTTTKAPPTEPTGYTAIGRAVFALYGDDVTVMICECYTSEWRGLTYNQACKEAERIAKMMNGQAI
jgi:hypothetical protein